MQNKSSSTFHRNHGFPFTWKRNDSERLCASNKKCLTSTSFNFVYFHVVRNYKRKFQIFLSQLINFLSCVFHWKETQKSSAPKDQKTLTENGQKSEKFQTKWSMMNNIFAWLLVFLSCFLCYFYLFYFFAERRQGQLLRQMFHCDTMYLVLWDILWSQTLWDLCPGIQDTQRQAVCSWALWRWPGRNTRRESRPRPTARAESPVGLCTLQNKNSRRSWDEETSLVGWCEEASWSEVKLSTMLKMRGTKIPKVIVPGTWFLFRAQILSQTLNCIPLKHGVFTNNESNLQRNLSTMHVSYGEFLVTFYDANWFSFERRHVCSGNLLE